MNQDEVSEPLSRYRRRALGSRARPIKLAQLRQEGELRIDLKRGRWLPFTAGKVVKPMDVAFEWDARVRFAPFIHIRVQDAYDGGEGAARVSVLSAITIAEKRGSAELNSGSLFRFLAEAPWYPSVLVPSEKLCWKLIDSSRATATLTDHDITVELEFRFDSAGDVAAIYAASRPRKVAAGYEMAAWEGHFDDYGEREGLRCRFEGKLAGMPTGPGRACGADESSAPVTNLPRNAFSLSVRYPRQSRGLVSVSPSKGQKTGVA